MLTTVLFDMGGTLEDIWYNEDTQRATCRRLLEVLRANGLEPGCPDDVFWKRITDGVKAYKQWSEGNMLEKKPEEKKKPEKTTLSPEERAELAAKAQPGRRVRHNAFGPGIVKNYGNGVVTIRFPEFGEKKFVLLDVVRRGLLRFDEE